MTKLRGGEGILAQKQKEYVTLRLLVCPGYLSSEQLRKLADIAEREGRGKIIITTRKGVEVPWIRFENAKDVSAELEMAGLPPGSCGRKVRAVVACAGTERCPYALYNVDELCTKLTQKYYGRQTPTKFKMSISGCPNSCSNPAINDFGVTGAMTPRLVEESCIKCGVCARLCRGDAITQSEGEAPVIDHDRCIHCGWCIKNCPSRALVAERSGFSITVGGKSGRIPELGMKIADVVSEEGLFQILENTFAYFERYAEGRERIGKIIRRMGVDHFKGEVLRGVAEDGGDG
ncbi:MAG: 4Fe-4S dicluster domain-containing protein [Methanobacteriota archaeon]|nr:MAG: 4Fe-4S dicluster domain-containing protein [Euryarchaeota archaeon]